MVLIKDGKSMK